MAYHVEVRKLQRQPAAVIRFKCPPGQVGAKLGPAYGEIGGYLHQAGIEHEGAGVYARFLAFVPEFEVEAGFTLTEPAPGNGSVMPGELPECEAAMTTHVGPYDGLIQATNAVRNWMAANGREPGGGPWELYLSDPDKVPAAQLQTEVYVPLKP